MSGRLGLRKKKGRKPAKIMTAHSLESYNRGEDLVEIFSFDLREAICYEAGSLSTIGLNVKYPTVFNDPAATRAHYDFNPVVLGGNICFSHGLETSGLWLANYSPDVSITYDFNPVVIVTGRGGT